MVMNEQVVVCANVGGKRTDAECIHQGNFSMMKVTFALMQLEMIYYER